MIVPTTYSIGSRYHQYIRGDGYRSYYHHHRHHTLLRYDAHLLRYDGPILGPSFVRVRNYESEPQSNVPFKKRASKKQCTYSHKTWKLVCYGKGELKRFYLISKRDPLLLPLIRLLCLTMVINSTPGYTVTSVLPF